MLLPAAIGIGSNELTERLLQMQMHTVMFLWSNRLCRLLCGRLVIPSKSLVTMQTLNISLPHISSLCSYANPKDQLS